MRGSTKMMRILTALAIAFGLVALAGSYYVWSDNRGEYRRISSELAQMKVSLQLLGQRAPVAQASAAPDNASAAQIADLKNRLAILEGVWRNPSPAPASTGLPPLTTGAASTPPGGATTDCIPLGTRFLLTPNDTYPVCETQETLTLVGVAPGVISLEGIGDVGEGGIVKLGATNCRVVVLSAMADGGFAEVRVSC